MFLMYFLRKREDWVWYKLTGAAHTQESWHQQSQCKILSPEHAESNLHNK